MGPRKITDPHTRKALGWGKASRIKETGTQFQEVERSYAPPGGWVDRGSSEDVDPHIASPNFDRDRDAI